MEFVYLRNVNIKEEPFDYLDKENTEFVDTNTSLVMDVDPMNLLEPVAERCSGDEEDQVNMIASAADDGNVDKWQHWLKAYPWLLREDDNTRRVFCLYCGKYVNVEGGISRLQRHDAALIHKERQQNYEGFLRSCQDTNEDDGLLAIKKEFEIDNVERNGAELISKRLMHSKTLSDYNWSNWLSMHKWLVRRIYEDETGTKGYCKYCKCEFDVEFSLTRQRHENSTKHKIGEKLFCYQVNGESSSKSNEIEMMVTVKDTGRTDENSEMIKNIDSGVGQITSKVLKGRLFERVSHSGTHRRCRICRVVMDIHSCRKHMKTKMHRRNLQALAVNERKVKKIAVNISNAKNAFIDWSKYTKIHSWICADPIDPKYAYCSYCEKRFMYGLSSVKRALHENSNSHREATKRKLATKMNESDANNYTNAAVDESVGGEYKNNDQKRQLQPNNSEFDCEENEVAMKANIAKRSKRALYTDEWFKLNPCYQRHLDDADYIYCKCCKVLLLIKNFKISRHERAGRHRICSKEQEENINGERLNNPDLQSRKEIHGSGAWIGHTKNGQAYCKLCRMVLSRKCRPAAHERTERHKLAAEKYFIRKNMQDIFRLKTEAPLFRTTRDDTDPNVDNLKTGSSEATEVNIFQWQQKYVWLSFNPNEERDHYGYCNYCEQSVYVPTATFASKHESIAYHIRAQLTRQNQQESSQNSNGQNPPSQNDTDEQDKRFTWLLPDPEENVNYGYCKFCKIRIMTDGTMILGHYNSKSHRLAAKNVMPDQKKEALDEINCAKQNSVSDERSRQINATGNVNADESGSEISLANRLTNAHAEILNLIREMRGNSRHCRNRALLSAPLSIAASLSPSDADICFPRTMEPHRLESSGLSQTKRDRNTYDLFFESMNETVKRLPSDLAAESRVKIMQIVYDLEMRALQRTTQSTNSPATTPLSSRSTYAARDRSASLTKHNDDVIPDYSEQSTNH